MGEDPKRSQGPKEAKGLGEDGGGECRSERWPSWGTAATSAGAAGLTRLKSSSTLASDPATATSSRKIAAST